MSNSLIGARIRSLRTERGLSQEQLAKHFHVDRTTVAKWESGSVSLTTSAIQTISSFFGVSPVWLAGLDDVSPDIETVEKSMSSFSVQQLHRIKKYADYLLFVKEEELEEDREQ